MKHEPLSCSTRSRLVLVGTLVLVGCVEANTGRAVDAMSADAREASTADAPVDSRAESSPSETTPVDQATPAEVQPVPVDGPAEMTPRPDGGGPEVDGPAVAAECTPRARMCSQDGRSARVCSSQGRWTDETCSATQECSVGVCLCKSGSCDEGEFIGAPGSLHQLALGRDYLFFTGPDASTVSKVQLATRTRSIVSTGIVGDVPTLGLAANLNDDVFWCMSNVNGNQALLKNNDELLEKVYCQELQLAGNFLYGQSGSTLFRRALSRPGMEPLVSEPYTSFTVTDTHLYVGIRRRVSSILERSPLAEPSRVEELTNMTGDPFEQLVSDDNLVFIVAGPRLLRIPVTGAKIQETVWQDVSAKVSAVVLTQTHVYWSASTLGTPEEDFVCKTARAFRQPKQGGPITTMAEVASMCAVDLAVHDSGLFLGLAAQEAGQGPARIHRLHR